MGNEIISPICVVCRQIDNQIESFNKRRKRHGAWSDGMTISHMLFSSITVALIAINVSFDSTIISVVAIIFSVGATLLLQILQYFKYRERLQIAIATVSRLRALRAKIDFEVAVAKEAEKNISAERYFNDFQNILGEANQSWSQQIQSSKLESDKDLKVDSLEGSKPQA